MLSMYGLHFKCSLRSTRFLYSSLNSLTRYDANSEKFDRLMLATIYFIEHSGSLSYFLITFQSRLALFFDRGSLFLGCNDLMDVDDPFFFKVHSWSTPSICSISALKESSELIARKSSSSPLLFSLDITDPVLSLGLSSRDGTS